MRVYLVRHGQTAWNADGRAQGHSDVDLDQTGLEQAQRLCDSLRGLGIRRIYTSDLKRCVQTATPLSQQMGIPLLVRDVLRERTFGILEGKHYTEIRAWFQAEARLQKKPEYELRPEGAESLKDVWKRVAPMERELDRTNDSTVIFSHGGTCGLLLGRLIKANVETGRSFRFENASVTELIRRPDGFFQLLRYNDTTHLTPSEH
ncbi:MAG: histidine phosphatase family protein [Armatimonadota bacterium]